MRQLESFLGYVVKRLHLALTGAVDAELAKERLTSTQFGAMSVLARHPGLSGAELAAAIGVSEQATSTLIERLAARGLLERHAHPIDRRRRVLRVSPTGRSSLARAVRIVEALEDRMLATLAPAEQEALRELSWRALGSVTAAGRPVA